MAKRWIRRILTLVVGLGLLAALGYAFRPQPIAVDVDRVTRDLLRVTVDEDGRTRIKERYVVSAPLAGRLLRIQLRPGDVVTANETLLAVVEPSSPELLDARALAQAEARVKAAAAALERTGTFLESARVALEFAESELNRVRQLVERKTVTRRELEEAQLAERQRSEEFRAARFAQDIATFELDQAQAALLRTQPDTDTTSERWHFEIRAPISGRVLRVFQESSVVATPGMQLLELGNPHDLEVEIDVLSSDAVKIHPGDKVLLEQWGGERPLEGSVRLVEPSAFTKVSALGVEEQRVYVIADFVDPPESRTTLGDGFRVEARIVIWERADILQVPISALFRFNEQWSVFRQHNGRAKLQPVRVGRNNGLAAEVQEGLADGDVVVIHPSDKITDGALVIAR